MKRSLTPREGILLALLAVIAVVSGYVMLFYNPMTTRRDTAREETELCQIQIDAAQIRLAEKRRMEQELEELFARDPSPRSLAAYDNMQAVMLELHTILERTQDYSLSFGTVDTSESIVRRNISLSFSAGSYQTAKEVLRQLHDSAYRCMLDGINLGLGQEGGGVSVTGNIVFFEYQK